MATPEHRTAPASRAKSRTAHNIAPQPPQEAPTPQAGQPSKPPPADVLAAILGALVALARLILVWATPEGEGLRRAAAALALACSPESSPETPAVPALSRDRASSFIASADEHINAGHAAHRCPLGSTPCPLTAADLADLREQTADIIAAGLDATAPPSRRKLGRSEARRQIQEAARKLHTSFALAENGDAS